MTKSIWRTWRKNLAHLAVKSKNNEQQRHKDLAKGVKNKWNITGNEISKMELNEL